MSAGFRSQVARFLLFPVRQLDQAFEVEIRVMRLKQQISARLAFGAAITMAAVPVRFRPAGVRIRTAAAAGRRARRSSVRVQAPAAPAGPEVQLTADEAVRMALENNLGVRVGAARRRRSALTASPQARAAFTPSLFSTDADAQPRRRPTSWRAAASRQRRRPTAVRPTSACSRTCRGAAARYTVGARRLEDDTQLHLELQSAARIRT